MRSRTGHSGAAVAACIVLGAGALVLGGGMGACGGQGTEAPRTIGAHEDTGCPAADEALGITRETLGLSSEGDALEELRPELRRILVEEGGVRVLLRALTELSGDVDRATIDRLIAGIAPSGGFGTLTPYVVELLRYIDGSSTYAPGPHLEPLEAAHAILAECEAPATLDTVRGLLLLEVKVGTQGPSLVPPGAGDRAWLGAVVDAASAALADPAVRTLLEGIELAEPAEVETADPDGGTRPIRVGREAFVLIARLLAANLAAPDFDPTFTRRLLEDTVVVRIEDEQARTRFTRFLDLVLLVTDPSADVFPKVQSIMRCVNEADANAAIPALVYDGLTIDGLSVHEVLANVSSSTQGDTAAELRRAVIELLGAMEAHPALAGDIVRVVAGFFDERTGPILVRSLLRVQGTGVLAELTSLAGVLESCREEAQ